MKNILKVVIALVTFTSCDIEPIHTEDEASLMDTWIEEGRDTKTQEYYTLAFNSDYTGCKRIFNEEGIKGRCLVEPFYWSISDNRIYFHYKRGGITNETYFFNHSRNRLIVGNISYRRN